MYGERMLRLAKAADEASVKYDVRIILTLQPSDIYLLARETERLLGIIPKQAYVILLDLAGRQITSPELAEKIQALALKGHNHICFVIGGAFGYTDDLRRRADFAWSFSRLTFTHQMIRVLLVEQVYRAFKISRGEKYHW